jgi:transcriptional regulator with XRE-family HTH domain
LVCVYHKFIIYPAHHVPHRIRLRRVSLGLTQDEVARALRASPDAVAGYEAGERHVPVAALCALARLFEVELSFFFETALEREAPAATRH